MAPAKINLIAEFSETLVGKTLVFVTHMWTEQS